MSCNYSFLFLCSYTFSLSDDPDYFYDYVHGLLDGLEAGVDSRDVVNIQNVGVKAD